MVGIPIPLWICTDKYLFHPFFSPNLAKSLPCLDNSIWKNLASWASVPFSVRFPCVCSNEYCSLVCQSKHFRCVITTFT